MSKRKTQEGEIQQVEEFEVYCPIALANIWGMDNTLADRCISLILEKSSKNPITKLIENFESDMEFMKVRGGMLRLTENLGKYNLFDNLFVKWNEFQQNVVSNVSNVNVVSNVSNVKNPIDNIDDIDDFDELTTLFLKVNKSQLCGRDLELFFPLFIISDICGELNNILEIAVEIVRERRETDREENRDVALIEFLTQSEYGGFVDVARIVKDFQEYLGEDEKWINSRGISRALKRLGLVVDRHSTGRKRQVKLDIEKACEKLLMFKEVTNQHPIPNNKLDIQYEKIK